MSATIRMSADLRDRINRHANERGVTAAGFIEELLEMHERCQRLESFDRAIRTAGKSYWDEFHAMGHLGGCLTHVVQSDAMQTISKRDLNQHTAEVLARVTDAHDVVVTQHGKPRWRVSIFHDTDAPLARMEREGYYTPPASTPAPWPSHPGGSAYTDAQVEALLDEMKGDH